MSLLVLGIVAVGAYELGARNNQPSSVVDQPAAAAPGPAAPDPFADLADVHSVGPPAAPPVSASEPVPAQPTQMEPPRGETLVQRARRLAAADSARAAAQAEAEDLRVCRATAERPPNATVMRTDGAVGEAPLAVSNGTASDAVVLIYDTRAQTVVRAFYVRNAQSVTVEDIPYGTYVLRFALGRDYSGMRQGFCVDLGAEEFDQPFAFEEKTRDGAVYASGNTVTLNKVIDGNAKSHRIAATLIFGR